MMDGILAAGIGITIFSALLLLINTGALHKNKFAILCLMLWCLRFFCYWIRFSGWQMSFPWIILIEQNLLLLDGVFLYWFVLAINGRSVSRLKQSLQLLPFILFCGMSMQTYFSLHNDQLQQAYNLKVIQLQKLSNPVSLTELVIIVFIVLQNYAYLFLSIRTTKLYEYNLRTRFSNLEKIDVNWLNLFLKVWALLFLLPLLTYFVNYLYQVFSAELLTKVFIVSMIALAIVFGFRIQQQQYVVMMDLKISAPTLLEEKKKYTNSGLSEADGHVLFEKLLSYMTEKHAYLNPELTMLALAQEMGVSGNILSQVINSATGRNFYDFINNYRIDAVKADLENSDDPVMMIGWKNGFNSKSAFNDVFKKNTGLTPTQYRRRQKT